MSFIVHPLDINLINQAVSCGSISYFSSIDSTNSYLLEQGRCGDICMSDMQTAGRGRRGNRWISPQTGNIYFSQTWCFEKITKHWSLLGLITGIAIAEALEDIGLTGHGVKWPNDIYWKGQKLGGILLETSDQSGEVVIGIGLNYLMPELECAQIDQSITSLQTAMQGKLFSREQLVIALIKRLHKQLSYFDQFNLDEFKLTWKKWDILQDKTVSFEHQGTFITGKVVNIDDSGQLGILQASGECAYFSSADVRLARLPSKDQI